MRLGKRYDLVLPFDTPYRLRRFTKIMPYADARDIVRSALAPLAQAVTRLREMGLPQVMVAELPPPAFDENEFEARHGFKCRRDTLYKATLLFNDVLREICREVGAIVISAWSDMVDQRGYLKSEFALDGGHLNRAAGVLILRKIIAATLSDLHACVNSHRYELAYKLAEADRQSQASAQVESLAREFHTVGICRTKIPELVVDRLVAALEFESDVGNRHARVDWSGNPVVPFSTVMRAAMPDQSVLDLLYETLYAPEIASLMQRCMGRDVWYANSRPFQSLPHLEEGSGPQFPHHDGCPPHVLRSIIYLVDVDEENGPFEYVDDSGTRHHVLGARGTLFIFDGNRLLHRATPPRARERRSIDFVILPRLPSQPRRVMWAGINNWPGDPFHFSINGMRASPPCVEQIIATNPLSG